jgi:GntR family transcriptional regulator
MGAAEALLKARLHRWLESQPPSRWLVIEPDPELRAIVIDELEQALGLPVAGCAPDECADAKHLEGSMPLVLPSKAAWVRKLLPAGTDLTVLAVQPVSAELLTRLQRYLPEHAGELIGVASRWGDFQRIAKTMLIAAGLSPESLLVRDATQSGWKRGLEATSGVVCDSLTARALPEGVFALHFKLLGETMLEQLREREARRAAAN